MNVETIGLGVIAASLVGILGKVVFHLLKVNGNHLRTIQKSIDSLPCNRGVGCPEEEE